nr:helix-turn-helix domain-containing protein [Nakamurella aerolata]
MRQALALRSWRAVRLLAGPAGEAATAALRRVELIADVRAPVPTDLQGALLAVAGEIDRDDWHLDVLIRRTAAGGAAGLLIAGTGPIGTAATVVADRLAVTILGTDDPIAGAVALRVHLAQPELERARWVTAVADAVEGAGDTVDAVVTGAAAVLDRSIWLVDSGGNVVVGPTSHPPDPPESAELAAVLAAPESATVGWVLHEVATDHPRGAYLMLRRREHDELAPARAALSVLAVAIAGRLAVQRLSSERDARQRMSLLAELLQPGGPVDPQLPRRMLEQGWRLDGYHEGIRIDVPAAADPVALRPEVLRAFADAGVPAQVVEQGAGWAAWCTFADLPAPKQREAHASAVRRVQWLLRARLPTVMGVGSLQPGAEGLVRSLGEAGDAAKIAATRTAGGHLVQVDRLGLSQLLLAWTRTETFGPAASSLLTPLQDEPALLATLSAYLEAQSSIAETAAILGVHRNTVTARISKAVELLGIDLGDPDERLAVQLACRSVLAQR